MEQGHCVLIKYSRLQAEKLVLILKVNYNQVFQFKKLEVPCRTENAAAFVFGGISIWKESFDSEIRVTLG